MNLSVNEQASLIGFPIDKLFFRPEKLNAVKNEFLEIRVFGQEFAKKVVEIEVTAYFSQLFTPSDIERWYVKEHTYGFDGTTVVWISQSEEIVDLVPAEVREQRYQEYLNKLKQEVKNAVVPDRYVVHYSRYMSHETEDFDTLENAQLFFKALSDYGEGYPLCMAFNGEIVGAEDDEVST